MRPSNTIPRNQNFKSFFDNYFISVWLIKLLRENEIITLGLAKLSRMESCVLKNEKELRKEGQVETDSRFSSDGDITVVRWLLNGIVNLASSFVSVGESDTVHRFSASEKQHLNVSR